MVKYSIEKVERKKLFRYFTPATLERLCDVLVEANRYADKTLAMSLKRNVLTILNNYYIDYPNSKACWRGIQEIFRMYEEEDVE